MRTLVVVSAFVMITGCRSGSVGQIAQPIVGGVPTTGYPYVGYVGVDLGGGTSGGCTGTLVRDRWVLTAAHCLDADGGQVMGVKVTFEPNSDNATTWLTAKSWQQHPQYGKPVPPDQQYFINRGYDCALVELAAPIAGATPIAYGSFAMDTSYVGKPVTQIGYGFTDGNGDGSGVKRMLATTIGDVHDGVLGLADNTGTGTCQGDSGGPSLWDAGGGVTEVIGVASYGTAGCHGGGFMSRTELCAPWLDSVAGPFVAPDMGTATADMATAAADLATAEADLASAGGSGGGGNGGTGGGSDGSDGSGGSDGNGNGNGNGSGGNGVGGSSMNPPASGKSGCAIAGAASDGGIAMLAALVICALAIRRSRKREIAS